MPKRDESCSPPGISNANKKREAQRAPPFRFLGNATAGGGRSVRHLSSSSTSMWTTAWSSASRSFRMMRWMTTRRIPTYAAHPSVGYLPSIPVLLYSPVHSRRARAGATHRRILRKRWSPSSRPDTSHIHMDSRIHRRTHIHTHTGYRSSTTSSRTAGNRMSNRSRSSLRSLGWRLPRLRRVRLVAAHPDV